jgi:hypothetical protein
MVQKIQQHLFDSIFPGLKISLKSIKNINEFSTTNFFYKNPKFFDNFQNYKFAKNHTFLKKI